MTVLLIIFLINIVYVSFFTVRLIFVMKGKKLLASILSMAEVYVYLMGLNLVLSKINEPLNLAAYCVGWGSGVYLGSKIEEWLALGYVTLQIVVDQHDQGLPQYLREKGFGVTIWHAEGRDGKRIVMQVLAKRSNEKKLVHAIQEQAPKAFVISYEPRFFKGGFWVRRLR